MKDDIYKSTELPGNILYAHWAPHTDPNVVPITFDANGGTMTDNAGNAVSILTKRKVIGYQMGSMPEPEQEDSNYIFDGWWMQPNGGTKVTSKTAVTGPMTVYAHWTIGNLVFLEKNGGAYYHKYKSAGNIENKFKKWNPVKYDGIQVANGQKIPKQAGGRQLPWTARGNRGIRNWRYVMKPNGGTKTVKAQWKGWYTQPNGAGTKIKWNSRYYDSYGDTLYANWRERSVIRYDANGGKWGKSTALKQKYPYVDKKLPKVAKPKKRGYQLVGWYDAPVGGNKVELKNAAYLASQDMTLYAHWIIQQFTVKFDSTGGSVSPTYKMVTYNTAYGTLPTPTRNGYQFEGWFTKKSGGTQIKGTEIYTRVKNQTLYAHWKALSFTVSVSDITTSGFTMGVSGETASLNVIYYVNTSTSGTSYQTSNIVTGLSDATTRYVWAGVKDDLGNIVKSIKVVTEHSHTSSCYTTTSAVYGVKNGPDPLSDYAYALYCATCNELIKLENKRLTVGWITSNVDETNGGTKSGKMLWDNNGHFGNFYLDKNDYSSRSDYYHYDKVCKNCGKDIYNTRLSANPGRIKCKHYDTVSLICTKAEKGSQTNNKW